MLPIDLTHLLLSCFLLRSAWPLLVPCAALRLASCFLLLGLRAAWRFNCLACRETWPARPSRDRGSTREVHALQ